MSKDKKLLTEIEKLKKQLEIANNRIKKANYGNYCKHLVFSYTGNNQNRYQDMYQLFILDIWEHAHLYNDTRLPEESMDRRIKMWLATLN